MLLGFEVITTQDGVLNYIGECDGPNGIICSHCEGDCDYDSDCAAGTLCFHRDGSESVPGCSGGTSYDASGEF